MIKILGAVVVAIMIIALFRLALVMEELIKEEVEDLLNKWHTRIPKESQ